MNTTKQPDLRFNLVAAIFTRKVNNQPQFTACVVNILSFECLFLGLAGPHQTFIDIQQTIDSTTYSYDSPTSSLAQLQEHMSRFRLSSRTNKPQKHRQSHKQQLSFLISDIHKYLFSAMHHKEITKPKFLVRQSIPCGV